MFLNYRGCKSKMIKVTKIMFTHIDAMKEKLQQLRQQQLIHLDTENSIREKWIVDWTYHSNAIEGNSLTRIETRIVLESGLTVSGKPLKDHLEAIDHKEAILFMEELAQGEEELSESHMRQVHAIVLQRIRPKEAGRYRNVPVTVGDHLPPQPWEVPIQMEQLMQKYHGEWKKLHPLERAAYLHCDFVRIHPFVDGNGRTARLIMNLEWMKYGYPPVILPVEARLRYYQALQSYDDTNHPGDFLALLMERAESSITFYLSVCGQSPPENR
jgi:Fic family protein